MSDAAYGAPFEVQLKVNVGRKQLRVQALGPGRARIQF